MKRLVLFIFLAVVTSTKITANPIDSLVTYHLSYVIGDPTTEVHGYTTDDEFAVRFTPPGPCILLAFFVYVDSDLYGDNSFNCQIYTRTDNEGNPSNPYFAYKPTCTPSRTGWNMYDISNYVIPLAGDFWISVSKTFSSSPRFGANYIYDGGRSYENSILGWEESLKTIFIEAVVGYLVTDATDGRTEVLPRTELLQNYPNPFNATTTISFKVKEKAFTTLEVFNIQGQKIVSLFSKVAETGTYNVFWDGTDASGSNIASGVYFYRLKSGKSIETKRMILLK
jgi:hypothetical protein